MRLPFQIVETFATDYTANEVIGFVREGLDQRRTLLFISIRGFIGSINGRSFKFREVQSQRQGRFNPTIEGRILSESPTTLELKISPNYAIALFTLIFAIMFILAATLSDEMEINGVQREPDLTERFAFGIAGCLPMAWGYYESGKMVRKTKEWIAEGLKLKETYSHPH